MTLEEIKKIIAGTQTKLNEINMMINDIESCKSEKSIAILLAAASKLIEPISKIA